MSNSGQKNDQGKPDLSLISLELVEAVARVREFGAKKYSRNNWKNGFKITRSCAAALRHIFSFLNGETLDPESGLSHLAHAICSLEHAIYDMQHHPDNDDRAEEAPLKTMSAGVDFRAAKDGSSSWAWEYDKDCECEACTLIGPGPKV